MKLTELRPCDCCGGALTGPKHNNPVFQCLRTSIGVLNGKAMQQTLGLAQYFGGSAASLMLAEVFSPEADDVGKIAMDEEPRLTVEILMCQHCYLHTPINLAGLVQKRTEAKQKEEEQRQEAKEVSR